MRNCQLKIALAKKALDADDREVARSLGESALQENPFHVPSLLSASRLALEENRLQKGFNLLMTSVGAGFTVGSAVLRWSTLKF